MAVGTGRDRVEAVCRELGAADVVVAIDNCPHQVILAGPTAEVERVAVRLRDQDIHRIVDTFTRQVEIARYSRMVPLAEIGDPKNDFNLNLPRYIDSSEPEDLQASTATCAAAFPTATPSCSSSKRCWRTAPIPIFR